MDSVIELIKVSKTYRNGLVTALNEVDLSVRSGDFLSIMGPSGCGKSTLLNMLGALDTPTSGSVLFSGRPLASEHALDRFRATQIGFVFQSFYLLPNLTAEENVQLPMFEGTLKPAQRSSTAQELLASVGLKERFRHLPDQLSNGQRQRVAIARALANNPSIILADEPTGALDSESGGEVMDLLSKLHRDRSVTLIIVTHDRLVAERAAGIIEMRDGRILSS